MKTKKRLFYDIETSFCEGHFWRPGFNQTILPHQIIKHAQIICISWKWEGEEEVHNLNWGLKEQCDKKLLKEFIKELNKADEIVAHNGDSFDIKWIRTRALYHNIPMRNHYNSIDTYKLCKSYLRLPSNKLAEVAKYYNLPAKIDAGGMTTWTNIVFNHDRKALDHMLYYCDGDVITLEAVYNKLRPYVKHKFNYAVAKGGDKFECPECGNLPKWNKSYTTSAGTQMHYMKCRDKTCGIYFKINNKTYMDYIKYKFTNGL